MYVVATYMAAQYDVNLEKCCAIEVFVWKRVCCRTGSGAPHLPLKSPSFLVIQDKSSPNTSFESVKTLRLFVCTLRITNETLCF